ncbi:E3 ubiquitin/ISG15 ligase TRIM25-like [Hyla sarda]|uniref:E3 ubiquitin/ISG15 ligase TRIM25-like n=1 Tax=Hyla sarda TaxID=327740 RepID=UPI0024C3575C|nr:E3 ubiquitin/ISG15 ligase TRIM25-like [Hyla sarda]
MALSVWGEELTCCICLDIYKEPVTLSCGHSFCMECIRDTFETQEGYGFFSCPECRDNFKTRPLLQRNLRLNNIVETFMTTRSQEDNVIHCNYCVHSIVPAMKTCLSCEASLCALHIKVHNSSLDHVLTHPTTFSKDRKCSVHNKILEYYCTQDATCICTSCRLDGDHISHPVETLRVASEKKKEERRRVLEKLTAKKQQIENKIHILRERQRDIHDRTVSLMERASGLFKEITDEVKALEKEVLREITRQDKVLSLSVSDVISRLEIQNEELLGQILECEQFCSNPDPLTVLREQAPNCDLTAGNIPLPPTRDLDEGPMSLMLRSGLGHVVHLLSEGLKRRFPQKIETSNVLLDSKTAHRKILLSADRTRASSSPTFMNYPDQPERFRSRQVLSSTRFSSGKHHWQVDLSRAQKWIVGVAYQSIERKVDGDESYVGYNDKSWGLTFRTFLSAMYNKTHRMIPLGAPPQSVGIYLDYDAGRLSFYQLQPTRHLHTFMDKFTEPLCAAFYVFEDSCIRIK